MQICHSLKCKLIDLSTADNAGTPLSTLQGNAATLKYRLTLPQRSIIIEIWLRFSRKKYLLKVQQKVADDVMQSRLFFAICFLRPSAVSANQTMRFCCMCPSHHIPEVILSDSVSFTILFNFALINDKH